MSNDKLKAQLEFYKNNLDSLVREYEGKFLIIANLEVQGAYDSELEAYSVASKLFEMGSFLIQRCESGEQSYTQTFHSRVILA